MICIHCGHDSTAVTAAIMEPLTKRIDQIEELVIREMGKVLTALQNLQTADVALKAEVTQFLANVAARLTDPDADVQAVADDINAEVALLQANDPGAAPSQPVSGTVVDATPTDGAPATDSSTDSSATGDDSSTDAAPADASA